MEVTRKIKDPGTKARVLDRQAERRRSTYEDTGSLASANPPKVIGDVVY